MYEIFTVDTAKKENTFNLIEYINSMKLENKYDSLNLLFHKDLPINSWLFDKSYILNDEWDFHEELCNYIFNISLLELGEKFAWSNILYRSGSGTYFYSNRLTVSNFIIQEYRASQSKNVAEYFENNIKVPMLFPMRLSDFEKIRAIAKEDSNLYNYPTLK